MRKKLKTTLDVNVDLDSGDVFIDGEDVNIQVVHDSVEKIPYSL